MSRGGEGEGPLAPILRRRIAQGGPMPLAEYMGLCLAHPEHGYYTTRDPLGAAGDFVTAPEISQMFGELLGLWIAQAWADMGAPRGAVLAELAAIRNPIYAEAHIHITSNKSPHETTVNAILKAIRQPGQTA